MSSFPTSGRRRVFVPSLLFGITLTVAACNPIFGEPSGPVRHATLTSAKGYAYAYDGDAVTVTATQETTFEDGNVREVFWNTSAPYYPDQEACITWETLAFDQDGGLLQPGLAMRIAPSGPDGRSVKAITVTQNIWAGAVWILNVHVWDSSTDPVQPFRQVGAFDGSRIFGRFVEDENGDVHTTIADGPWHLCAQTRADRFTFKVWSEDQGEPGWDDPDHVSETILPAGWDHAGYSGGYIGHLRKYQSATFSGFTTTPLCLAPDMAADPECQTALAGTAAGESTVATDRVSGATTAPTIGRN